MFIFTSLVPGTEKFDDFVLDPASRRPPVSPVFTLHRYNINMVKRSNNKIERRKSLERNDCSRKKGKVACIASIFPHAMIMQSGEWLSKSVGATPGTWWVLTSTLNDELQAMYGQSPER